METLDDIDLFTKAQEKRSKELDAERNFRGEEKNFDPYIVKTLAEDIQKGPLDEELRTSVDLQGNFNFLINKKNLTRPQALEILAIDLADRSDVPNPKENVRGLIDSGVMPETIISYYTGARNPNVVMATLEGAGRGLTQFVPASEAAMLAGRSAFAVTPPILPFVGPFAKPLAALGAGTTAFLAGLFVGEKAEKAIFPDTTVVPSKMPFLEGGRGAASVLGTMRLNLSLAKAIPEKIDTGIVRLFENLGLMRDKGTAKKITNALTKVAETMGKTARTSPGSFLAAESVASIPVGIGGTISEYFSPGEALPRIAWETGASLVYPQRVIASYFPSIKNAFSKVKETDLKEAANLLEEKRKDMASDVLVEQLQLFSQGTKDPDEYIVGIVEALKAFNKDNPILFKGTPGQILDDEGLILLEKFYSRGNSALGRKAKESGEEGLQVISRLIEALKGTGTPEGIRAAFNIRKELISDMIKSGIEKNAATILKNISKLEARGELGETVTKRNLSQQVTDLMQQQMKNWRQAEKTAYDAVDMDETIPTANLKLAIEKVKKETLLEEPKGKGKKPTFPMPQEIKSFIEGYTKSNPSIRDLIKFRSLLLDKKRTALAGDAPDYSKARIYRTLSESILDDFGIKIQDEAFVRAVDLPAGATKNNIQKLKEAYDISRAGNDVFTRSFAGRLGKKQGSGEELIDPELALSKMMVGTPEDIVIKYEDLEKAASFVTNTLKGKTVVTDAVDPEKIKKNYHSLVDLFLRQMAEETLLKEKTVLNPVTNKMVTVKGVDDAAAERFIKKYKEILDFPAFKTLKDDLINPEARNVLLESVPEEIVKDASDLNLGDTLSFSTYWNRVKKMELLEDVLETSPQVGVAKALSSTDPEKKFNGLVRAINKAKVADPDIEKPAKEALLAAVFDYALEKSTKPVGSGKAFAIDPTKFRDLMLNPKKGTGIPAFMTLLKNSDIVDKEFVGRFKQMFDRLANLDDALNADGRVSAAEIERASSESRINRFGLRVLGATVAKKIANTLNMGASLQVPQAGADVATEAGVNMPKAITRDIIINVLMPGEEKAFLELLEKGLARKAAKDEKDLKKFFKTDNLIRRTLGSPAVFATPTVKEISEEIVPSEDIKGRQPILPKTPPKAVPFRAASAPPPRPAPPSVAQATTPPVTQAAPSPVTRGQYAAMFPMDSATTMMKQQENMQTAQNPMQRGIGSLFG
tara:strand:- start:2221 stop:5853 length:3633 start_codon:yes stop_codon:yes gene_type:complete